MDSNPITDAMALYTTACAFDSQRRKVPQLADPHRLADLVAVARQSSDLGAMISEMGDEVFFLAFDRAREPHTDRVINGFVAAIAPAGEATAALGSLAQQFAFLNQSEHLRDQPDTAAARVAARQTIEDAILAADSSLAWAAEILHAASASISPPSARMRAALHRSTTTGATPKPPTAHTPAPSLPADRPGRSR